jgi:hypothetical protein
VVLLSHLTLSEQLKKIMLGYSVAFKLALKLIISSFIYIHFDLLPLNKYGTNIVLFLSKGSSSEYSFSSDSE